MALWKITDQRGFQALLVELASRYGTQRAAARRLGITDVHFSNLVRGKPKRIGQPLLDALVLELGTERVGWVMLSPEEAESLENYQAWLRRRLRSYVPMEEAKQRGARGLADLLRGMASIDHVWREQLRGKDRKQLARFETWCREEQGHSGLRTRLAIVRILEPLLEAEDAGGIELSVRDLRRDGRLSSYLRIAIARERVLLKRDGDVRRARASLRRRLKGLLWKS